jgi:hypothetical protein
MFETDQQSQIKSGDGQVTDHLGYMGVVEYRDYFGILFAANARPSTLDWFELATKRLRIHK